MCVCNTPSVYVYCLCIYSSISYTSNEIHVEVYVWHIINVPAAYSFCLL